jgi:hypothetical protein
VELYGWQYSTNCHEITDETIKVWAYNFPRKQHFSRKTGDYREHVTHYLMIGSVSETQQAPEKSDGHGPFFQSV